MLHTIQNQYLTVAASEKGAELQSIRAFDGTEYLWQGDARYWKDRALNIFPYVARLTEGQYEMDQKRYKMPIHGLAPYVRFSFSGGEGDAMTFVTTDTEETRNHYPRRFAFRVSYALREDTLSVTYEVENRDEKALFFGLGGHPGFNVPLRTGLRFSDYRLEFSQPCQPRRIGFTPDCFLDGTDAPFPLEGGTQIPLRHELFDDDAVVLTDMTREVTLFTPMDAHGLTVSFPQMPYLGLWHAPETEAPYLCIEPWCTLPSKQDEIAVFERDELLCLLPGELLRNQWQIRFFW